MHRQQSRYIGPHHWWLTGAAILLVLFSTNEIVQRALIQVSGVVVSSYTTPGNRPATYYVVRDSSGVRHKYVAGATDSSLPRWIPIGTYINKKKYELSWLRNNQTIDDFPLYFYCAIYGIALALGCWAVLQRRLNECYKPAPWETGTPDYKQPLVKSVPARERIGTLASFSAAVCWFIFWVYGGTVIGCRAVGAVFIFMGSYGLLTRHIPIRIAIFTRQETYNIVGSYAVAVCLASVAIGVIAVLYPTEVLAWWNEALSVL